ncbi:MAG: hypothetical protein A2498_00165 [Lentisphaerae bacterium RIFOXYC12_FULL_60_16]|nr:MAG: hypothetical protein A2498_00165 [Lentisphaerae bacterium RIFOXYC12_FULL_60_16]
MACTSAGPDYDPRFMKPSDSKRDEPVAGVRTDFRFERCARLVGAAAMQRLADARVAVFGLGGVGSYAAEGLARSGVGHLTAVDFDRVCVTNINRQIQALTGTVGQSKAELMRSRMLDINPRMEVNAFTEFYNHQSAPHLLDPRPDVVIDCIDNVTAKMHLVARCIEQQIPVITSLGAGAKLDPSRVRIVSLMDTHTDPLGRALRKHIRRKHPVTDEQLAGVFAVFSDEPVRQPITDQESIVCGVNCVCPGGDNAFHSCKRRHVIYGTMVFVTAVFGMAAAGAAVKLLLGLDPLSPSEACDACGAIPGEPPPRRRRNRPG